MRTIAWVAAALAVAFTAGCADRDRRDGDADTGDRVEASGEQASGEVREGAAKTEDAAKDAADNVGDAADDAGDAVEDAADEAGLSSYAYDRRDEFRKDVDGRLAAIDKELAELRQGVNEDAAATHTKAVEAARETRKAVGRNVDRLAGATAANWDELQDGVRASLDSLDRQLRKMRPDARPMGGTGPS